MHNNLRKLERFASLLDECHLVAKHGPGSDYVGKGLGVEIGSGRFAVVEPDDREIDV